MKSKKFLFGLILLSVSSAPALADSFYLNVNNPGVSIGVNTGAPTGCVPEYWYYGGQRYYGAPVPPRNHHDKQAWKIYQKKQKAYQKYLKECRKANKKYHKDNRKHHHPAPPYHHGR